VGGTPRREEGEEGLKFRKEGGWKVGKGAHKRAWDSVVENPWTGYILDIIEAPAFRQRSGIRKGVRERVNESAKNGGKHSCHRKKGGGKKGGLESHTGIEN